VTFGGGSGVLSADQCAEDGLTTPPLAAASRERLADLVTPLASVANPIDLTPDTYNQAHWLARLPQALDAIAADPGVHTVFFQLGAAAHRAHDLMDAVGGLRGRSRKAVCVAWPLAPPSVLDRLPAEGIYPFPEIARAVRAIGHLARYRAGRSRPPRLDGGEAGESRGFDWPAFVAPPTPAGTVVSEPRCHAILAAAGLATAAGGLAGSPDEALRVADGVGYPVALKGISPAVTHRAAAGLVALGIRSEAEAREAFARLTERARALSVGLEGIYVQHMVAGGLELLVSAFRDPVFGVMVACGAGGNLTEVIDDVVLERAPVGQGLARHMLGRLRIVRHAGRLAPDADVEGAAPFVARFSRLGASARWRRVVVVVNPIRVGPDGPVAVDGLLVVEEP
jgi:acetyltransferase